MAELNKTHYNLLSFFENNPNETLNLTWLLSSPSVILDLDHHGVRVHQEGPVGPLELATALASLIGLLLISKILQKCFHLSRNH